MSEISHKIIEKGNARISLTITVPLSRVTAVYNTSVKEIAKKAQIKGFRKGNVPVAVLEKRFGDALKADSFEKLVNESVQEVLKEVEKKPLPYARPELQKEDTFSFDISKDFIFTIEYDTIPCIEPCKIDSLTILEPKIRITDNDIEEELRGIQDRNAITIEKQGAIANGDVVSIAYSECDEKKNEIHGTKRENYTLTVGEKEQSVYDIGKDLIGMSKDEEKIITKTFSKDYAFKEYADKTVILKVFIENVKQRDLPDIDDELAQDFSQKYKTLDDLKKDLRIQLGERAQKIIEDTQEKQIMSYLVKNSKVEVPASAVQMQLESFWQNFVRSNGNNAETMLAELAKVGKSKDMLMDSWKQDAEKQVISQFLVAKLREEENITCTDEDVIERIKSDCEKTGADYKEIKDYYTKHNLMEQIKDDLAHKKLFEILKKRTTIKKEGEKSFLQIVEGQNNE